MKQILEKLKDAEIKSSEIIQKAKNDASLLVEKEHKYFETELASIKKKLEKEKEDKLEKAKTKIASEKESIIKESKSKVTSFKKKASSKKDSAVKEVVKTLLN